MFADITGFTRISESIGAEQAYAHVTACVQLLDGILRRHGAAVDKYLGDSMLAVFGAPIAMSDPAAAAARAALEMQLRVGEYNRDARLEQPLGLCVGINTGSVTLGDVRGQVVREFHVLGDTVNTAARIKAAAEPGVCLMGEETWREIRDDFDTSPRGAMRFKGKSQPVPVYEVSAARRGAATLAADVASGELHGRGVELSRLREHVDRLCEGRGGVVIVRGEEGIGKSRLLAELAASEACETIAVLRSQAGPATEPFAALAGFLPGEPFTAAALDEAVQARVAQGPVLMLLDDAHAADTASLDAVSRIATLANEQPLLLVLAARDAGGAFADLVETLKARHAEQLDLIALGPLERREAQRLIDGLVAEDVSDAERALILERGGGNPQRLTLASFVGGALQNAADLERREVERTRETERRRSTVLFADISGFTAMSERLDPESMYQLVADCLSLLDGVARKHGATVDSYLGDCVLAVFGVPRALEDSPRAAVNAAIEMVEVVQRYSEERALEPPLQIHIGVSSGLGIAGEISGPLLREFAVMGDPVVFASELADVATHNQIFVGPNTHRFTRDDFDYQPAGEVEIKGRAKPVAAFELVSRVQQLRRRRAGSRRRISAALVGRDEELRSLRDAVSTLRAGRGGVASVIAEAGVGKSRLLAELAERERDSEVEWVEGRAISMGAQLSFHVFADLFRNWAEIGDQDDEFEAAQKLSRVLQGRLGDASQEVGPLISAVAGVDLGADASERLERIQPESRERLIHAAISEFVEAASEKRPVVLVFDDLHWADQSSIGLLESLLDLVEAHPILIVPVFRPGYLDTSERIRAQAQVHLPEHQCEIELRALDSTSARDLIKSFFVDGELPHATRTAIEEKSRGNPFYIEEVLRSLLDAGAVAQREDGLAATDTIGDVEIPDTVNEVIMARTDRLPLRIASLLRVASVIGHTFHQVLLEEFAPDESQLEMDLSYLVDAEFLTPSDRLHGKEYAFKHPLIHETTYDAIVQARREELHLRVAAAVESRLSAETTDFAGMLAYHYSKGRDAERAEWYLFRAGDEAARVAASSEALYFFREASKLYLEMHGEGGDLSKKALIEKKIGLALYNRGQLIEADDHFSNALRHLGEREPASRRESRLRFVRNLLNVVAALYLPFLRRRRQASEVDREVMDLMMKRAEAQTTASPQRFLFDSMDTVARLDQIDVATIPGSGGMYAGTIGIFSYGGVSFAIGRRLLARAAELVDPDDHDEFIFYRVMSFLHHLLEGDWSEEHAIDDALLERGVETGHLWEVSTYLNLDGLRQIYRGDYARARGRIDWLSQLAERFDHDLAASASRALPAILHLERHELDEALATLDHYYDAHAEAPFKVSALGNRAEAELLGGRFDAAETSLERANRVLADAGRMLPYHHSSFLRARYDLDVARLEAAGPGSDRAGLERAAKSSRRAALAVARKVAWRRPGVLRSAARHAFALGDEREAARRWRECLATCEELGARADGARTRIEIGSRSWTSATEIAGASPQQHLREGCHGLRELGLALPPGAGEEA